MRVPKQLQLFAEDLQKTIEPSLNIYGEIREAGLLESKFGGRPYWLKGEAYPTAKSGEPLRLLAQINLSEIESPIPDFPTEGDIAVFCCR